MSHRIRHLISLAVAAVAACAEAPDVAPVYPDVPTYTAPVVLFVQPDSAEVERVHRELGDDAFYVTADDAMWYQAKAMDLLDSADVRYAMVRRGEARFVVRGSPRPFGWSAVDRTWFLVIYDGANEPVIASSVDLRDHLSRLVARR